MFGEALAYAEVQYMPVDVVALEKTRLVLIDAERVSRTCGNDCGFHSRIINNLLHVIASKNLMMNQKLEVTSKRSTREKLMAYLMLQAKQKGSSAFTIPFDRQELADYLEVDRSGLSAEIGKLRREGLIECSRSDFTIIGIRDP
jgi:CRP-like cAMP-binding protein